MAQPISKGVFRTSPTVKDTTMMVVKITKISFKIFLLVRIHGTSQSAGISGCMIRLGFG